MVGVAVRRYWVAVGDGVTTVSILIGLYVAVQVGGMDRPLSVGELAGPAYAGAAAIDARVGDSSGCPPQAANPVNNPTVVKNKLNPLLKNTGGLYLIHPTMGNRKEWADSLNSWYNHHTELIQPGIAYCHGFI
jgi:hypothetical protein